VLAVAGAARIQAALIEADKVTKSEELAISYNVASSVSLLLYKAPTDNGIMATNVSCKGEIDSYLISLKDLKKTSLPVENLIEFVAKRSKQREYPNALAFRCTGAVVHKHGRYMVIAYSLWLNNQLRYPIPSEQSTRFAFLPLPNSNIPVEALPVIDGSCLSTWWEVAALSSFLPREERAAFHESLKESLTRQDPPKPESGVLETDLETVMFSSSLDVLRFLNHLDKQGDLDSEIRRHLGETILEWVPRNVSAITDIDRAIVLSFCCVLQKPVPVAMTLGAVDISNAFVNEAFDFGAASDSNVITSVSGHAFARCSLTLLPLTCVDVVTCHGCGKKALSTGQLPGPSLIGSTILRVLDACVFCGGRFLAR
jgi:hypothetical protein